MSNKVIAIDIFEINSWYRFNVKTITNEMIIDFSKPIDIAQIGFFAEEHDVFFASLPDDMEKYKYQDVFIIPFEAIKELIPLSEQAKRLLSNRLSDFTIASPVSNDIYTQIIKARNQYLSKAGGEMILKIFTIEKDIVINYENGFLEAMQKYPDLDKSLRDKSNLFDWIVLYDREKPYPNNNAGFLFDTGFICQEYFSNKDISLQKELKNLILFLQENKKEGSIFSMFLKKYSDSEAFQTLDKNITLVETPDDINTLLVIAFYLKFRKMIRDKEYAQFKIEAETFLKKLKKETSIALFFIGMFFGSTEFIEMYYQKSLSILKTFSNKSLSIPPTKETPKDVTPTEETPKDITPTEETPKDVTPTEETPKDITPTEETPKDITPTEETPKDITPTEETPKDVTPTEETPKDITPIIFDDNLYEKIEKEIEILIKKPSPTLKNSLKQIFDDSKPKPSKLEYYSPIDNFIEALKNIKLTKKEENKYTKENIINIIKSIIRNITTSN